MDRVHFLEVTGSQGVHERTELLTGLLELVHQRTGHLSTSTDFLQKRRAAGLSAREPPRRGLELLPHSQRALGLLEQRRFGFGEGSSSEMKPLLKEMTDVMRKCERVKV